MVMFLCSGIYELGNELGSMITKNYYKQQVIQDLGYSVRQLSHWNTNKQFVYADVCSTQQNRKYSWYMMMKLALYHEIKIQKRFTNHWMSRDPLKEEIDKLIKLIEANINKKLEVYIDIKIKRHQIKKFEYFLVIDGNLLNPASMISISHLTLRDKYRLAPRLESEGMLFSHRIHELQKTLDEVVQN